MPDQAVTVIPGDGEECHAKVDGAVIVVSGKGDAHALCLMIAAFTFHRDRLHMGCDSLPDLRGKRRHKRADSKWPSTVDNIGQIQQTDRHVFGIVTGGRKITNDFFSIFHMLIPGSSFLIISPPSDPILRGMLLRHPSVQRGYPRAPWHGSPQWWYRRD